MMPSLLGFPLVTPPPPPSAAQGAVEARNANYANICRHLTFSRRAWYAEEDAPPALAAAGAAPSKARERAGLYGGAVVADDGGERGRGWGRACDSKICAGWQLHSAGCWANTSFAVSAAHRPPAAPAADADSDADSSSFVADPAGGASPGGTPTIADEVVQGEGMREADMLLWLGDFNYRIEGGYEAVKEKAVRSELGALLELVRLRRPRRALPRAPPCPALRPCLPASAWALACCWECCHGPVPAQLATGHISSGGPYREGGWDGTEWPFMPLASSPRVSAAGPVPPRDGCGARVPRPARGPHHLPPHIQV
jgi:hypothetical protein